MDNISHVHRLRVVNFDSSGTAVKSQASNSITKKKYDENPTFKIEVEKSRPQNKINDHSLKIKKTPHQNITKREDQKIHHHHKRREDRAVAKPSKLNSSVHKIPKYTTKTGKVKFGGVKTQGASTGSNKKHGSIRSYSKNKRKSDVNELKLLFLRGTTLLSSLHNFSKDVLKSKNKCTKNKLDRKPKNKKEKTKEVNILFSREKEQHKKFKKNANKTSKRLQSFDDIFGFRKSNAFFNYQSSCSRSFCRGKKRKKLQCPIKRSYSCENQASNVNIKCVRSRCSKNNSDPCALHSVNIMQFPLERKEENVEWCTNLNNRKPSICKDFLKKECQANICCSGGSGDASQICTQAELRIDQECPPCLENFINEPCPPNQDWCGPDKMCRSEPKLRLNPIETPCFRNERKQGSQGKKCLKYILFVIVILSWAPCIFVVILCWLITYPLRPHWIRSQKCKTHCYSGKNHRLQRYRCNQCRIPLGFWSSFVSWIKDFKWTNTSPYEALAAMLRGDRCSVKRKVVPNPEKQYALYHTSSRGWVMKPMQLKNTCIQRHYNCTIDPCYPQKPTCNIEIREPCPTKKKRRKKKRSKICIPVDNYSSCRAANTCRNLVSVLDLPAKTCSDYKVCIDHKPPCPVNKKQCPSKLVDKPCAYDLYTGTLTSPCERPPCKPCLPKPVCKISIAPCPQRKNLLKDYLRDCRKSIKKTVSCGVDPCRISPSCTTTRRTPCANNPCNNLPFSNVCHRHPCDFGQFCGPGIPNILSPLLPRFCNLQTPLGYGNCNQARNQVAPCDGLCNRDQQRNEQCKTCKEKTCTPVVEPLCSQPRRVCGNLEQPRTCQPSFKQRCWRSVCYCVNNADRHLQEAHCRCYPKIQEPKSWAYKCCPTMYPMFQIWNQCVTGCCHLCLYILSACVWCPPILCCYMCYKLMCSCACR